MQESINNSQTSHNFNIEYDGIDCVTAVSTNGVLAEEYGYDASGRRAWIASGGSTNYMVYDGEDLVAEVDSNGDPVRSYVHGPGIDNLLAFTDYTGGSTNTYYALTDHIGSVTALADASGAIVESYEYDSWGNITVYDENGTEIPQSQYGNRFTFQGREYSWATGLYNFRARWYDPETGRWLSKDPIGIAGGLNQYVAFGNNPVNFIDPAGLDIYLFSSGGSHSYLFIDDPSSGEYREFNFQPANGGRNNLFTKLRALLVSGGSLVTWRPVSDYPKSASDLIRIPTTEEQDCAAIAEGDRISRTEPGYGANFNCADACRQIIQAAVPVPHALGYDNPKRLNYDIQAYLSPPEVTEVISAGVHYGESRPGYPGVLE